MESLQKRTDTKQNVNINGVNNEGKESAAKNPIQKVRINLYVWIGKKCETTCAAKKSRRLMENIILLDCELT